MAKIGDIRHWKAETLEKLFDTASAKAASLRRLGEGMEQVANDLSTWGGTTADAWRESAGKTRVDLGDNAEAADKVAKAVKPAIDDVRDVTNKLGLLDQDAQAIGAKITDDGKVVATVQVKDTDKHLQDDQIARLQKQVIALEQRATTVEQEIAAALRADVTDAPPPPPKPGDPSVNASAPVAGPDQQPPYKNGAVPTMTGETVAANASASVPLTANPPGYDQNMGPGAARDQAWKDYLSGKNADGSVRPVGAFPAALPKPEAVSDPALRTVGAAGRQQGVSYAWGGNNSPDGPTRGTLANDEDGGAHRFEDDKRIGFDCGGLSRFAVYQGYGLDLGPGTWHQFNEVLGGQTLQTAPEPGDLAYYGPGGRQHVAIYLGNGVLIEARQSGEPVELMSVRDQGGQPQWMRPHAP